MLISFHFRCVWEAQVPMMSLCWKCFCFRWFSLPFVAVYWDLIDLLEMSWNGASSEIRDPIWKLCFGDHSSDSFYSSRLFFILLRTPEGQNSMQLSSISCDGASFKRAQIPQYRRWFVVLRVPGNVNLEGTLVFVGPRRTNCGHFGSSFLALRSSSQNGRAFEQVTFCPFFDAKAIVFFRSTF